MSDTRVQTIEARRAADRLRLTAATSTPLAADVPLDVVAPAPVDGPSVSLTAGRWLVVGHLTLITSPS